MLNKVIIMGRFVRDPEMKTTPSGVPVVSFSLACERDVKNKQTGERETDFIDVTAWRSTAEFISKFFSKGRMAVVVGSIQTRSWMDREGNKRHSTEVLADSIYFGDSKKDVDNFDALCKSGFVEVKDNDDTLPF